MERDTTEQWGGFTDRGQSVFDFSIGVSLFLLVVIGVLVFVPTAFGSFGGQTTGGATDGLAAQRGLDHLGGAVFADSGQATAFHAGCTLLFFNRGSNADIDPSPGECGLDPSTGIERDLGLSANRAVNVTLERDVDGDRERDILCWTQSTDAVERLDPTTCGGANDVEFRAGPNATANENYAVAETYGKFDAEGVYLVVRVW